MSQASELNSERINRLDQADLEQLQQEDALYPWLADDSMADYTTE